jgi:hypothetical protein
MLEAAGMTTVQKIRIVPEDLQTAIFILFINENDKLAPCKGEQVGRISADVFEWIGISYPITGLYMSKHPSENAAYLNIFTSENLFLMRDAPMEFKKLGCRFMIQILSLKTGGSYKIFIR